MEEKLRLMVRIKEVTVNVQHGTIRGNIGTNIKKKMLRRNIKVKWSNNTGVWKVEGRSNIIFL